MPKCNSCGWIGYYLSLFLFELIGIQATYAETLLPPVTVWSARRPLETEINNPQQLDEEEIVAGHERAISDVLTGLPGVTTTRIGGYGQLSGIFLRGAGGQGLVTFDDIPLLVAVPGLQNFDSFPTEAFKSAVVQRGPDSSRHSFQALGGTIRLYTQDREETGGKLSVEGGTFGTLRENLVGGWAGKLGRLTFTASRVDAFDGSHYANASENPEREPFRSTLGMMRFSTDITPDVNWQGSLLYRNSWIGTDKFMLDQKNFKLADVDSFGRSESWIAQNSLNVRLSKDWSSHLQLGYTQLQNRVNEPTPTPLVYGLSNRMYLANWRNQHTLVNNPDEKTRWQINWGGQGRHESVTRREDGFADERTMASGFLETEARYHDLSGQAGFRFEHYDQFGDHTLLKAAAAYEITSELTLRASGGTGFRIPAYTERLFRFLGNPTLKPERSASGEVGLEWFPLQNMSVTVNGYYNRYDNLITQAYAPIRFPASPASFFGPTTVNVADASVAGVEVNTRYTGTNGLDAGFSYTFSDNRDLQTDLQLPLRPSHIARIWGQQRFTQLPITLWAEAIIRSSAWNDPANTQPINQSIQLNASIRYTLNKQFEVYLRGENLTNTRTPQFYSTNMPGAMVFGGFQLSF
ncbi:TonB-dependent receptor plug domain-containing protein [Crenothrix polyspora]|uniref:Vitamin B12 transporter BtuB n=1 Tax=Crenothrix polyspora TaxID=360316 RepID=A0A1R4H1I5_9GAMM|nr:TonB-dependent receptor [Crenothrix polyspora]SJM90103.1 Vitamin B12 transporter BtuB [Crenothrix polyspora]